MSTSWFMKSYSDWLSHEKTNTSTVTNIYEIGACCEFNELSHNVNANRNYSVHTLILKKISLNVTKCLNVKTNLFSFPFVLFIYFFLFCIYDFFSFVYACFIACAFVCFFFIIFFVMCLMLCENVYIIWVIII